MTGKDLIHFIILHRLEDVKIAVEDDHRVIWRVPLDEEDVREIEYRFSSSGKHEIVYYDWTNYDVEDLETVPKGKIITERIALTLRKKHGKI